MSLKVVYKDFHIQFIMERHRFRCNLTYFIMLQNTLLDIKGDINSSDLVRKVCQQLKSPQIFKISVAKALWCRDFHTFYQFFMSQSTTLRIGIKPMMANKCAMSFARQKNIFVFS